MRLLIAILLFLTCAVFTPAASNGYANYEGLVVDIILTAILIPSVMALPFCLPKSGRNVRRFLKAYNFAMLVVILFQVKDLPVGKEKAIASTEDANNSEVVGNDATNKITNGEFIISIPDTWAVYVPNGETYLARIESEIDKIEMYIGYDQNNTSLTHEEYALSLERNFKSNMSGDIFVSKLASCGINDVECRYKIFNVVDGDREITSVVASFSGSQGHYRVSMNTLTSLWEENSEIFFKTIRSFRLL